MSTKNDINIVKQFRKYRKFKNEFPRVCSLNIKENYHRLNL